jgi:hypothetical protein
MTLLGGVIADVCQPKTHHDFSQLGSASIFFTLATLVVIQWVALWHVMTLAFYIGLHQSLRPAQPNGPAATDGLKKIFQNAVAVGGTIWQLNRLVGPAVAGLLIYLVGIGPTYYFLFLCVAQRDCCLWLAFISEHQPTAVSSGEPLAAP